MNWLIKMAKPLIKKILIKELEKEATRSLVIDLVNTKVDLPKLSEHEEEELFNKIYDAVQDSLNKIVERL